jgi:mannitol-1-phosphate 5-dehydrogenase
VSAPRCVVFGTGRVAGGFLAPLLRSAGWETILVGRNRANIEAINAKSGLWLDVAGEPSDWIGGVRAVSLEDPSLPGIVAEADLVATAVGPSSLHEVGRVLAPMLQARLQTCGDPVNIVAFENHRRAGDPHARSPAGVRAARGAHRTPDRGRRRCGVAGDFPP